MTGDNPNTCLQKYHIDIATASLHCTVHCTGLLNRTQKMGRLSPHSFTTEDWFHTLHDTQTVWKHTGHTTRPFIPVVDRGRRVYSDSHQKHHTRDGRGSTANLTSGLARIRWQYSYMAETIPRKCTSRSDMVPMDN